MFTKFPTFSQNYDLNYTAPRLNPLPLLLFSHLLIAIPSPGHQPIPHRFPLQNHDLYDTAPRPASAPSRSSPLPAPAGGYSNAAVTAWRRPRRDPGFRDEYIQRFISPFDRRCDGLLYCADIKRRPSPAPPRPAPPRIQLHSREPAATATAAAEARSREGTEKK
ncbi:hypothetical protein R5R35_002395 [Gryllus longicercus]|uniref:Uncharacterized protein n=1 Tax=Gryllus longicercus TaxID=2509291 RepID=A0AAN9V8U6_9ORTH